MVRAVPPPDFRYVWLAPSRGSVSLAASAASLVAAGAGALLWSRGYLITGSEIVLASAALALGAAAGGARRLPSRVGAREASMAIVPWGVHVTPDTDPRVLRWPAIRRVTVDVAHSMRDGTPITIASVVTVDTGREQLTGRTWGAAGLEALTVHLDAYAEESSRPVALDLDGRDEAGDGATEPVMAELLARANDLCTTASGAALLDLPPGGYRTMAAPTAGPETLARLRTILASNGTLPADARPLAAIVAVQLGARELVPDLLRLVSSPHPVVAAVAKAAALRLGAAQSRAGAVDEVAAFLFEDDFRRIEQWAALTG